MSENKLSEEHLKDLQESILLLENPGIAAKITNFVGKPIESVMDMIPKKISEKIGDYTHIALMKSAEIAIFTMKNTPTTESSNLWHKVGSFTSGAIGGFFGLPALAIELPISTTITLRSIADIARSQGESIDDYDTKLACLEVFALGGKSDSDDASENGYFAVRAALAKSITEAAEYLATKTIAEESAVPLIKFITKVAERLSIQVTEKFVAQAIPAIGAAGGAIVNTIFLDHFQDMAKGHFTVIRLEKIYGKDFIQEEYIRLNKMTVRN